MMPSLEVRSSSVSSERPRWPRSAWETALGETPASRASSLCDRWRWRRIERRAPPRRAAAWRGSEAHGVALELVAKDGALDAERPAFRLRDAQPPVADGEDALGDLLDLTPERERVLPAASDQ